MQIKVPYTTKPSMSRLVGSPAFITHPDAEVIRQKTHELDVFDTLLYAQVPDTEQLIQRACIICGKPSTDNIRDFALYFQEDVALIHSGTLAAVCFCFPSSWQPSTMIGKSLTEIHSGVADGDHLRQQSARIAQTICDQQLGSFERWVWTVTVSPHLSNHPLRKIEKTPTSLDDLYFRTEHQTTLPLGDGVSCLFFVDVKVVPLNTVWQDLGSDIQASIASMTPAVLEYKNLVQIKEVLYKNYENIS